MVPFEVYSPFVRGFGVQGEQEEEPAREYIPISHASGQEVVALADPLHPACTFEQAVAPPVE